jgi:hypothetical protein
MENNPETFPDYIKLGLDTPNGVPLSLNSDRMSGYLKSNNLPEAENQNKDGQEQTE